MEMFKKISLYKWINVILFLISFFVTYLIWFIFNSGECVGVCSFEDIRGVMKPLYFGGKILTLIFAVLLFVPSHIFRKWLFYILPIFLVLTGYFVQDTSVYSSGIGHMSKAVIAENGMYLLGFVTLLFVLGHTVYDRKKKM